MRERCNNPNWRGAKYYSEKGISICEEWSDYLTFREWSLCNGYQEGLSLDRIDNNGNYCPENCRWTTNKVQANNRSKNKRLTLNGETKTLSEWADIVEIPYDTLKRRSLSGWSDEKTLTTPLRGRGD